MMRLSVVRGQSLGFLQNNFEREARDALRYILVIMNQRPPHQGSADVSTQSTPRSEKRFSVLPRRRATPGDNALVAGDILYGADAIAAFLFGDAKYRRRVYNLVEKKALPVFRIGASVCARKSVLLAFISQQEGNQ